jgi:hypothetical protein
MAKTVQNSEKGMAKKYDSSLKRFDAETYPTKALVLNSDNLFLILPC